MSEKYRNISIKTEFANKIERFVETRPELGYRSIAQFLEDAARRRLDVLMVIPPRFELINHDENGIKLHDRELHRVADILFKPDGVFCHLCESKSCDHIRFALTIRDLQETLKKKREEGWKIPEM